MHCKEKIEFFLFRDLIRLEFWSAPIFSLYSAFLNIYKSCNETEGYENKSYRIKCFKVLSLEFQPNQVSKQQTFKRAETRTKVKKSKKEPVKNIQKWISQESEINLPQKTQVGNESIKGE